MNRVLPRADDGELQALIESLSNGRRRRSKFHNIPTRIGARTFASVLEAERYRELRLLERTGAITDLRLQVPFDLHVPQLGADGEVTGLVRACRYVADFVYHDVATGAQIVEDTKGVLTATYRLKRRMLAVEYGIRIHEVRRPKP